ncbi:methyltransferase domain-containing protein [Streptomyces sp. LP05-1]|uniref:Protein-L-isoaspartate O-methyltransferase n=1 Tax=Streptomyces pyxinae TaxID=2970734 RepID=A0ABT2CEH5_9ACTN|nr:methyltransferase domain-containing protein [Streptomyces sp. LP05-1]MCS0635044.1 methyltransferase domain-containing protein [Streptomyces sp. LP05-1]
MSQEPDLADRVDHYGELTRSLLDSGALTTDWSEAFDAVPRAAFLPDLAWPHDMDTGTDRAVDRRTDPEDWERAVYANVPITTQWDDGKHSGSEPGRVPTSSASMPSVVTRMLADLAVFPDARVLEIGTGTGWNAGLLSARLGDRCVVTVEVDETVAVSARAALARLGLRPKVVCGDGGEGHPDEAPYDRVIVTAGVRQLPAAWLEQTRPGGLIVAPWGTHYSDEDALVRLTVADDGSASGPFLRPLEFMKLRAQRLDWRRFGNHVGEYPGDAAETETSVSLSDLGEDRRFLGPKFVLGLCVPDCAHVVNSGEDSSTVWFFDMTEGSRSWASVVFRTGARPATVHQSGPRKLWDEVSGALEWWRERGSPGLGSFGLTVLPDGTHRPWLAEPDHPVPSFAG